MFTRLNRFASQRRPATRIAQFKQAKYGDSKIPRLSFINFVAQIIKGVKLNMKVRGGYHLFLNISLKGGMIKIQNGEYEFLTEFHNVTRNDDSDFDSVDVENSQWEERSLSSNGEPPTWSSWDEIGNIQDLYDFIAYKIDVNS